MKRTTFSIWAFRVLVLYFFLKLLNGFYLLGIESFWKIKGFKSYNSYDFSLINTTYIALFLIGVFLSIYALIKREKINFKFGFTLVIFSWFLISMSMSYYSYFKQKSSSKNKHSIILENYPLEIIQIVKDSIHLKQDRIFDLKVIFPYVYSTTSSGGIKTKSEGVDSSKYSISAIVYTKDSVLLKDECYLVSIDTNLNYGYKMEMYFDKTTIKHVKWSKEVFLDNVNIFLNFDQNLAINGFEEVDINGNLFGVGEGKVVIKEEFIHYKRKII